MFTGRIPRECGWKFEMSFSTYSSLHIETLPSFHTRIPSTLLLIEQKWELVDRPVRGIVGGNLVTAATDTIR